MHANTKFGVVGLLFRRPDGKVAGPMAPFNFAKEMAGQMGFRFNRLARVVFEQENVLQQEDGDGYTGYDILVIGAKYDSGNIFLSLWIDMGIGGFPAAMCFADDRTFVLSPIYGQTAFINKLAKEDIAQIFNTIFDNPSLIDIKGATKNS